MQEQPRITTASFFSSMAVEHQQTLRHGLNTARHSTAQHSTQQHQNRQSALKDSKNARPWGLAQATHVLKSKRQETSVVLMLSLYAWNLKRFHAPRA